MVVFEELNPRTLVIAYIYKLLGHRVFYVRKKGIRKNVFTQLEKDFSMSGYDGVSYDLAFSNVDKFFDNFSKSLLILKITELYANKAIELVFKKALNEKLARFYYLNSLMNNTRESKRDKKITFIPSRGTYTHRSDGSDIYDYTNFYKIAKKVNAYYFKTDSVEFPLWAKVVSYWNLFIRRLRVFIIILGFLPWVFLKHIFSYTRRIKEFKLYKYAVIITSPIRQFANRIQKVDFLIDGKLIKKNEMIFLSCERLKASGRDYLEKEKLEYVDNIDMFISMRNIKRITPFYFSLSYLFLKEKSYVLEAALKTLYFYLRWKGISENIRIENIATHADFGIQSIARNIILEKDSCKTYYYMDSANFGCFLVKNDSLAKYRCSIAFLYGDYFVSWSDKVSEYFRDSFCKFKNYKNVGCLWAEHIRLIKEGAILSDCKRILKSNNFTKEMKLVSVFDTTFNDDSLTAYEDGIRFLRDVERLLEDMPGIFVALKRKKPKLFYKNPTEKLKEITETYERLERHPRCFSFGENRNPSEIIAESDLTISYPFTSTTFEAISFRGKAIWHDPTNKFSNTFYDTVPGLVCHDYDKFLKRTKELLYRISEPEYNSYLERYVKGKVESYLDGRAITRFRKLLNGEKIKNEAKLYDINV